MERRDRRRVERPWNFDQDPIERSFVFGGIMALLVVGTFVGLGLAAERYFSTTACHIEEER